MKLVEEVVGTSGIWLAPAHWLSTVYSENGRLYGEPFNRSFLSYVKSCQYGKVVNYRTFSECPHLYLHIYNLRCQSSPAPD